MADDHVDKASEHSKYRLRVTAGPEYDPSTHKVMPVNAGNLTFENEHIVVSVAVRLKHFTGFPSSSPQTSTYFEHELHKGDQYAISFSFIPKVDIDGADLVFGNDFDRPIRDRLPPGFSYALKIVKWYIDPGLEGDAYSDKPYLYGAALSSWNQFKICQMVVPDVEKADKTAWKIPNAESFHEEIIEEGASGDGEEVRDDSEIPDDAAGRKKYFLTKEHREAFTFEKGRLYQADFSNGYLDFNDFALKLPGFTLNILSYIDSKTHELRYTLKNLASDEVYCVILFTLLFGDELDAVAKAEGGDNVSDGEEEFEDASSGKTDQKKTEPEPNEDDLD